ERPVRVKRAWIDPESVRKVGHEATILKTLQSISLPGWTVWVCVKNSKTPRVVRCALIRQPDELAFATHPLDIERISGSKLRLIGEQEDVRPLTVRHCALRREHFFDSFSR